MSRRACLPLLLLTLFACRAPIEIVIDEAGVAHIYGQTDADAWYGAGYQVATDRLFQMEMLRRFAYGRLSEVLGEEGLSRDSQARIFDFPRWGQADLDATAQADPERAELISAWVAGINARIEEVRSGEAPRPFGFAAEHHDFLPEPWTEVDPYVVLKGAGFALDNTLEFEIALTFVTALYPDALEAARPLQPAYAVWGVPPEDQAGSVAARRSPAPAARQASRTLASEGLQPFDRSLLDFPRPRGSNNWALDGRSTATGLPMIAGDPHMGFDFFGAPYPLHVNSKDGRGTYDVAGFAFPGTPGIVLGHNDAVAWACTSAFGDVMDLWKVERVGDGIQLGGELRPLVRRTETILVRGEGDAVGEGSPAVEVYEEVEGLGVLVPTSLLPLPIGDYLVSWTGFTGHPARRTRYLIIAHRPARAA